MNKQTILHSVMVLTLLGSVLSPAAHAESLYSDIDEQKYSWAMQSMLFMNDNDVLKGYADGTFKPEGTVTKAEFTVMFYRLFDKYRPNLKATGYEKIAGYPDVPKNHWAYKEISAVYDYSANWGGGISVDDRTGKFIFQPELRLTRLTLTTMLYHWFQQVLPVQMTDDQLYQRLSGIKDVPLKKFKTQQEADQYIRSDGRYGENMGVAVPTNDKIYSILFQVERGGKLYLMDDVSSFQAYALAAIQAHGILTADAGGYYRPLALITRAEIVTILDRLYLLLEKNGTLKNYSTK